MIKIIVTGSARSGTGYLHALLNNIGLFTGHEDIFSPWIKDKPAFRNFDAESSWIAARHLSTLPSSVVLVHLHRHPLKVIESHLALGFFNDKPKDHHLPYLAEAAHYFDNQPNMTAAERAERYWTGINESVLNSRPMFDTTHCISLRDVEHSFIYGLLESIGRNDLSKHVPEAFEKTPTNYNHKRNDKTEVEPQKRLITKEGIAMAERLGYR